MRNIKFGARWATKMPLKFRPALLTSLKARVPVDGETYGWTAWKWCRRITRHPAQFPARGEKPPQAPAEMLVVPRAPSLWSRVKSYVLGWYERLTRALR